MPAPPCNALLCDADAGIGPVGTVSIATVNRDQFVQAVRTVFGIHAPRSDILALMARCVCCESHASTVVIVALIATVIVTFTSLSRHGTSHAPQCCRLTAASCNHVRSIDTNRDLVISHAEFIDFVALDPVELAAKVQEVMQALLRSVDDGQPLSQLLDAQHPGSTAAAARSSSVLSLNRKYARVCSRVPAPATPDCMTGATTVRCVQTAADAAVCHRHRVLQGA
jgi:hypothetical protein